MIGWPGSYRIWRADVGNWLLRFAFLPPDHAAPLFTQRQEKAPGEAKNDEGELVRKPARLYHVRCWKDLDRPGGLSCSRWWFVDAARQTSQMRGDLPPAGERAGRQASWYSYSCSAPVGNWGARLASC